MKSRIFALALVAAAIPATAQAFTYNAISISPATGAWGYASDQPSRGRADSVALYNCRVRTHSPGDCRVVMRTQGAYCSALVLKHTDNGSVGWGTDSAPTLGDAKRGAWQQCRDNQDDGECDELAIANCSH